MAVLLGACGGGTSEETRVAKKLLAEMATRNPEVSFRDISDESRNEVAAIIEFPAGTNVGEDLSFPGDIDGRRSVSPATQGSPYGGVKTFDSRYSFSGRPEPEDGWTCGIGLGFNEGEGKGEVSVGCYRMR